MFNNQFSLSLSLKEKFCFEVNFLKAVITLLYTNAFDCSTSNKYKNENNSGNVLVEYLKEIEKQRKEEYKERERKRDQRAQEKNDIMRELLEIMKKSN